MEMLHDLWRNAGIEAVETREIAVQRTFADFDDFWATSLRSPSIRPVVAAMKVEEVETLRSRLRARLPEESGGRITYGARAHAIKGLAAGVTKVTAGHSGHRPA